MVIFLCKLKKLRENVEQVFVVLFVNDFIEHNTGLDIYCAKFEFIFLFFQRLTSKVILIHLCFKSVVLCI